MGLVFIIYLIGLSLSKVPAVQSWTADVLSKSLSDYLETKVIIKDVSPGLFNRVIIDNVKIYDRNDSLMLNASRIAAKISLLPLLDKKVQIDNAQIIGADIKLYKAKGCAFVANIQDIHNPIISPHKCVRQYLK